MENILSMTQTQYRTVAVSEGGRNGTVRVEDSPLHFEMASPKEMGGNKEGANPEQLFAAGYAACFGSALQHVIRVRKLSIPAPAVQATVGIGRNEAGGYVLAVALVATFKRADQELADDIVREAHTVCPYSNATRGNIEVTLRATVE